MASNLRRIIVMLYLWEGVVARTSFPISLNSNAIHLGMSFAFSCAVVGLSFITHHDRCNRISKCCHIISVALLSIVVLGVLSSSVQEDALTNLLFSLGLGMAFAACWSAGPMLVGDLPARTVVRAISVPITLAVVFSTVCVYSGAGFNHESRLRGCFLTVGTAAGLFSTYVLLQQYLFDTAKGTRRGIAIVWLAAGFALLVMTRNRTVL